MFESRQSRSARAVPQAICGKTIEKTHRAPIRRPVGRCVDLRTVVIGARRDPIRAKSV